MRVKTLDEIFKTANFFSAEESTSILELLFKFTRSQPGVIKPTEAFSWGCGTSIKTGLAWVMNLASLANTGGSFPLAVLDQWIQSFALDLTVEKSVHFCREVHPTFDLPIISPNAPWIRDWAGLQIRRKPSPDYVKEQREPSQSHTRRESHSEWFRTHCIEICKVALQIEGPPTETL